MSVTDSSKSHSKILLWNPIFRRKLPPLKKIRYSETTRLFFGYHDDDYKVFKYVFFPRRYYVCIYSLSTNDWKVLEYVDNSISRVIHRYGKAKLVSGCAYFVDDSGGIIFFDSSREKFRKTKLPGKFWFNKFIVEEYRESLALVGYDWMECGVMWVLRVSDDKLFSWDKMSVTKLEKCRKFEPMGFINKDELVMWSDTCGFLYNVKSESALEFTTRETGATTLVQSPSNVRHCISMGVVDRLGGFNELRMYMIETIRLFDWQLKRKEVRKVAASPSTSNRYYVLDDSNSNRHDVFADSDEEEDIWSGC